MAKYRIKCPNCNEVANLSGSGACPKCGSLISVDTPAQFRLYRMGSPYGAANAFSIYINNTPYGKIGNKESLTFPLPYGDYMIHITCGMNRKCNDPVVRLTPDNPLACMKVHLKPGFFQNSCILESADPSTMPE